MLNLKAKDISPAASTKKGILNCVQQNSLNGWINKEPA